MPTATSSFDAIFCKAVEIPDTTARAAYLSAASGTDELLRKELEELIAAHFEAGAFLNDTPAQSLPDAPSESTLGTSIGPYKILQLLGQGGYGVVYLAEQEQPLRRQVALKVLKLGMDTRQVIARFESERQALALMNHPNIARVYDAGATALGRPYFVMELVRGAPITDYCVQNNLTVRRRLDLFVDVCQAVQHAHQKGIIHRDLKPSNILVATDDSKPLVKVIDFGIAKAMGQHLTDKTLVTGVAQFIGTPLYVSPEQALMNGLAVDTRSDVYALGVLLYELVTGQLPVNGDSLPSILRAIVEDAPTPPRRLQPDLSRDLDTITLKCLEKEPSRRYSSASDLADELRRYLADEPILARPAGALERTGRWARRNPAVASLFFAVGLLLTALGVGGVIAAGIFKNQRDDLAVAKRDGDRKLWEALLAQADANRLSRRPGQRFATLDRLQEAVALAKQLELPSADFDRMRNAAIAALAQPDLYPGPLSIDWPADTQSIDFPASLDVYARSDKSGTCSIRRVSDDHEIYKLTGRSPQFSRDGKHLALNQVGGGVHIWRLGDLKPIRVVEWPSQDISGFDPAGTLAACYGVDGGVNVLALASGERVFSLSASETGRDPKLAFHPTGPLLAVTSFSAPEVRIWDLESRRVVTSFEPDSKAGNYGPAWDPAGKLLAIPSGIRDEILLYEHGTWKLIRTTPAAGGGSSIAFNPSGDRLLARGWGGFIRLIDVHTGMPNFTTPKSLGPALLRYGTTGAEATGIVQDGKLGVMRIADGREYRKLTHTGPDKAANHSILAISPNGRLLAVGAQTGFGIWDLESGAELAFIPGSGHLPVGYVAFDPGNNLITNGNLGVYRWPIRADESVPARIRVGPPERLLALPGSDVKIAVSANGKAIAIAYRAFGLTAANAGAWALHSDRPFLPVRLARGADVRFVAISPDARLAVTVTHEKGGVEVWDARTGAHVRELMTDGEYSDICQFTSDGQCLLVTDRQWDTATWSPKKRVSGLPSPDGRVIAQLESKCVIRLLRADRGTELARLEAPQLETLTQYQFTPDGTKIVAGSDSGVHVWDLRRLRAGLAEIGLDWDEPPYPPAEAVVPIAEATVIGREAFNNHSMMDALDRVHLSLAITVNPLDGGAYYQLGRMEAASGAYERSFTLLTVAAGLMPDYLPTTEARAEVGHKLGRWYDVISDSTRVLDRDPANARIRSMRAMAFRQTGRPADAVADLTAVLKIGPKTMTVYLERADAYTTLGKVDMAAEDERNAAEVAVNPKTLNSLAWRLVTGPPANRNPRRALVLLSKRLQVDSENRVFLNTLGVVQYRNGLYREAVRTLEKSLGTGKGDFAAFDLYFLAMSHARLGAREKAQDCFDRAVRWLEGQPKLPPEHVAELVAFRAEAEAELGRKPGGD